MQYELARRIVPDAVWVLVRPQLPGFTGRHQGGGTAPVDERRVFTAVVYVLTSECPWRQLPAWLGVSPATAHRRFTAWSRDGVWERLAGHALGHPEGAWIRDIVDAALLRAVAGRLPEPSAT